jgi:hypothetical protein
MKETTAAIQPGTAALFVLVRKVTADKVLEGLKGEGGTVLKTSFDPPRKRRCRRPWLAFRRQYLPLRERASPHVVKLRLTSPTLREAARRSVNYWFYRTGFRSTSHVASAAMSF